MCVVIAALSLIILFSLHHEVVGFNIGFSSHHRSYSHIIISIYNTTLHYIILTCSSSCVDGSSSSGSGGSSSSGSNDSSSSSGSESCIII